MDIRHQFLPNPPLGNHSEAGIAMLAIGSKTMVR
jgi:hypothetical protein